MPIRFTRARAGTRRVSPAVLAARTWRVARILWRVSPRLTVVMVILTTAGGVIPAAAAWLNRAVLDGVVNRGAGGDRLIALAVALGGVGVVSATLPHAHRYIDQELRRGFRLAVQDKLFSAINGFIGLRRFENPEFIDQIQVAQQVSNTAPTQLVAAVFNIAQQLISLTGFFLALEVINPVLAIVVAATGAPAMVTELVMSRGRAEFQWQATPASRRQIFYSRLQTEATAAKELRLFGLGDFLCGRMLSEMRSIHRAERRLDRRLFWMQGGLALLTAGTTAGGLIWTIRQASAGRLTVGDVTLYVMAAIGVQASLSALITRVADVYEAVLMFGYYEEVVRAGPDLPLAAEPSCVPALRAGIELRDVWFRYDERHPWVLRGVTMFIPQGASVALIGLNGAGKTTLVKLICRLYDPGRGSILWDGVDIARVSPAELRARIGTVFQDYVAYDLTAAENIGLGDLDRLGDKASISRAAAHAGVHEKLARLPRGYDTLLSRIFFDRSEMDNPETGIVLSGGEWQRLALARCLMRHDRDLLILDEPSSGLDAEAEHAIHRRLCQLRAGRTSLLISHRLGSVRDADVIYVLSGGQITEQGTHEELMATRGEYHRMFTLQASGYNDGGHETSPRALSSDIGS
jgi:ATP-binding cassette subfamily B protein